MNSDDRKYTWLQLFLLVLPFCVIAALWTKLPDRVPMHWNARGEVNGYGTKAMGTLLLPCVNVFMALLLALLPRIDPKLSKLESENRASLWHTVQILQLAITAFMTLIALAIVAAAMNFFQSGTQFNAIIYIGVGLLFALVGNFLSKLRPNYFIGIRTPWTLESKEVWAKTHRVGGPLMMLLGLMIVLIGLLMPARYVVVSLLTCTIAYTVFVVVYSYLAHKKQRTADAAARR